ncbi:MAG: hypothetical protein HS122_05300 [Opitutaceae bacterium]|nr:hypothetical protein [Opitutaceae bacterium]
MRHASPFLPLAPGRTSVRKRPAVSPRSWSIAPTARAALVLALAPVAAIGQAVAPVATAAPPPEDVQELSPFEVRAEEDSGYTARDTLAGSRLKTELRNVASQIQVMTPEFLQDIGTVSVEDAFRYSINVENVSEYTAYSSGDFNNRVVNPSSDNRMRGLTTSSRSHDFFETSIFLDSYNSDRITYSSGPNAILFGVGKPSGIVDISFNRARIGRNRYSVQLRTDNYDSLRTSIDIERTLIPNRLAIRIDALQQNQNTFRTYSGENTRRLFGAFTFTPFKNTTIRGWMEHADIRANQARNTVFTDRVTPWINAGRPIFNNGTGTSGTTPVPSANDPLFRRYTTTRNVYVFGQSAADVPFMVWGASANPVTSATARYSVTTKGPGDLAADPDVYPYSLNDSGIFPFDVNVHGNGTTSWMRGRILGATVEQRIGHDLFIEASFNKEKNRYDFVDLMRGNQNSLYVDANRFLPDRVTPNPNVGRYFFEGSGRGGIRRFEREEARATVAYELDLRKRNAWLGHHRFGLLAQRTYSVDGQPDSDLRIVPDGVNPVDNWTNATYAYQWRSYVSNPQDPSTGNVFYLNLPFDPLKINKIPGYTIYGPDNPIGLTARSTNLRSITLHGAAFSMQSTFLKDRLVTTWGLRRDRVTNWSAIDEPGLLGRLGSGGANSAWASVMDIPIGTQNQKFYSGSTYSAGAVLHVTESVSAFFNRSTGWSSAPGTRYPDNSLLSGSKGVGTDYGLRFSLLDGRVSLRVNRYVNTSGPDQSDFRVQLRNPVNDIELIIANATAAGLIKPAPPPTTFVTGAVATYEVTSMAEATGYEFELTANLTRNWRFTLNGTTGETIESKIGAQWIDYIHSRVKVWSDNATLTDPESTSATTIRDIARTLISNINLIKQADGRTTEQARGKRLNVVTRYTLDHGRFKGAFAGAGYRWRSRSVVGYKSQVLPNEFPFAGIPDQIAVPDINLPVYGRPVNETELFFGYSRKLGRKVEWRAQLNIRNVFDDNGIIPQRANSVGAVTVFTIPEPRSFVLTNTFSF